MQLSKQRETDRAQRSRNRGKQRESDNEREVRFERQRAIQAMDKRDCRVCKRGRERE